MTDDNLDDVQPDQREVDRVLVANNLPPATWPTVAQFDGEAGTYSDPKCNTCSPVYVAWPASKRTRKRRMFKTRAPYQHAGRDPWSRA